MPNNQERYKMKKLKLTFILPEYPFELLPGISFPKPLRDLQECLGITRMQKCEEFNSNKYSFLVSNRLKLN